MLYLEAALHHVCRKTHRYTQTHLVRAAEVKGETNPAVNEKTNRHTPVQMCNQNIKHEYTFLQMQVVMKVNLEAIKIVDLVQLRPIFF